MSNSIVPCGIASPSSASSGGALGNARRLTGKYRGNKIPGVDQTSNKT